MSTDQPQPAQTTVMKFGGSCFQNSAAFGKIKDITNLFKNDRKIYVASALKGITNKLVQLADFANERNPQGVFDMIKVIEKQHVDTIKDIFADNEEMLTQAKKEATQLK